MPTLGEEVDKYRRQLQSKKSNLDRKEAKVSNEEKAVQELKEKLQKKEEDLQREKQELSKMELEHHELGQQLAAAITKQTVAKGHIEVARTAAEGGGAATTPKHPEVWDFEEFFSAAKAQSAAKSKSAGAKRRNTGSGSISTEDKEKLDAIEDKIRSGDKEFQEAIDNAKRIQDQLALDRAEAQAVGAGTSSTAAVTGVAGLEPVAKGGGGQPLGGEPKV